MLPANTPDLIALDLLDSVAELGSLGQAASRHRMSQPAVSMRMSQLEQRFGLELLRRDPSGTRLTPTGKRVLALSRGVLNELRSMLAEVEALSAEQSEHLRAAASLTLAGHLVPGWIEVLHRELPDVSLTLEVTNSAAVLSRVSEGRVDIGFVEGCEPDGPGLESTTLSGDELLVVVGPDHAWARRPTPVSGQELVGTELLIREQGSGTREVLESALAEWGEIDTRLELGSITAIIAAARSGGVPAVLSALAVVEDIEAGRLVQVETIGVDLTRTFRAVWPGDRPIAPLARRLLDVASS